MTTGINQIMSRTNNWSSIKENILTNLKNHIPDTIGRAEIVAIDLLSIATYEEAMRDTDFIPPGLIGSVQMGLGACMLFTSAFAKKDVNIGSLLKSTGDIIAGAGVCVGNLPTTISGLVLGAIGKTFEVLK